MIRDITMIISVLVSVVSVGFGVYKNIEANNAHGYAYEQAYRVLGVVQQANISSSAKATIANAALGAFGTPPPVVDLSRSSADQGDEVCTAMVQEVCTQLAEDLAAANVACGRNTAFCADANAVKTKILQQGCFVCF